MGSRTFEGANTQHEALISALAKDLYVAHVISRIESSEAIDHPIRTTQEWRREMLNHLQEKYDVSLNIGHAAISRSRANFRQINEPEA